MKIAVASFFLVTSLVGCATVDKSITPTGTAIATISGTYEQRSFILPQEVLVLAVVGLDGQAVTKNFFSDPYQMIVRTDAGQHQIRIEVSRFERCAKPPTTGAFVQLNANLEAGKNYKVFGKADGRSITVWLEEQGSGSRAPEEATADLTWKNIPVYPSGMVGC